MAELAATVFLALAAATPVQQRGGQGPVDEGLWPWILVPQSAIQGHLLEGPFKEPGGVFFDPEARELYVTDTKNGLVGIYDEEGVPVFAFGGGGVLAEPREIAVTPDGSIRVLDGVGTRIQVFDYRGTLERTASFTLPGEEAPIRMGAFAVDAEGNWFVGDLENKAVHAFDPEGNLRFSIPDEDRLGAFEFITGIAVANDGRIAVVDYKATPVQVFDRDGRFLLGFGERDVGLANFTAPMAVAFDSEGYLFVVDMLRHDVKIFDSGGVFRGIFGGWYGRGTGGRAPGELLYPIGIAIAPDGPVYVSERFGNRVQLFERRPRAE